MPRNRQEKRNEQRDAPSADGAPVSPNCIVVKGVRVHNLKNLDLELPRRSLVVITGPSGSGKSSLAFDTLYAEGQRRYIESLSSYAHQFLDQLPRPDVDRIEGLSPSLAIDQKGLGSSRRSTVGTVTEVYNFLRLFYARCGEMVCPECGIPATGRPLSEIEDEIAALPAGTRFYLLAPVVKGRKGAHRKLLTDLLRQGFLRVVADGELRELEEDIELAPGKRHDISVVVDGLTSRPGVRSKLKAALERAATLARGAVVVWCDGDETYYSRESSCRGCGRSFPELDHRLFSFNSPYGSCRECNGLGTLQTIRPDGMVPDPKLSIAGGAVAFLRGKESSWLCTQVEALAGAMESSLEVPFASLRDEVQQILLYGLTPAVDERLQDHVHYVAFLRGWPGLIPELVRRHRETRSEKVRVAIEKLMSEDVCPACSGYRLRSEALTVRIAGLHIGEVGRLPLTELLRWAGTVAFADPRRQAVTGPVLEQIIQRVEFLVQVGVGYICLARSARSLSGGEGQRVRLATQVGSRLTGVLYILDEPSVGLHHRDIHRLIDMLKELRDRGNSVIVVEHDRELMLAADHILDLGPGAGEHGGELVAQGTWQEVAATAGCLTGDYLAGRLGNKRQEPLSGGGRPREWIRMTGLRGRNLKEIDLEIPLCRLTVVTGVSGSGKSTALHDTFHRALAAKLHQARARPEPFERLEGIEKIKSVALVDQSPIGRSPRSTPATYTGLFTHVRKIFAQTTLAKMRGYLPGRFSYNTSGGRCPACEGAGRRRLTMDFLPDVEVICEDCNGLRYNFETMEVHFKGVNIAQVLDMTVEEAQTYFENIPPCRKILDVLDGVGLGYLRLGQAGATLSGGEAQRIKLAKELARGGRRHTLYILDEPTTGLHFCDVDRLLDVLGQLIERGNTVVVIEHQPDVIRRADHIIDLGPEGGDEGGYLVATGTLDDIMAVKESYTGKMLRQLCRAH